MSPEIVVDRCGGRRGLRTSRLFVRVLADIGEQFGEAGLVLFLPLITMVIPDVVVAASWVLILGKQGLVNNWLSPFGIELPSLYSWWGLVFVMTLNNYVFAFVAVLVGLKSMDRNLEEAALSLGVRCRVCCWASRCRCCCHRYSPGP